MDRFKVEVQHFENLSDAEKSEASDNGGGKEWASYLRVTADGEQLLLVSDAMEPEDCTFGRDLSWIKGAIQRAYEIGRNHG